MPAPHHSVFTGRMPFLPPNQQRQSTEGIQWHIADLPQITTKKPFLVARLQSTDINNHLMDSAEKSRSSRTMLS